MKYIFFSMLLCAVNAQDNEQQQGAAQQQGTAEQEAELTQTPQITTLDYDAEAQRRRDLEIQSYILPG